MSRVLNMTERIEPSALKTNVLGESLTYKTTLINTLGCSEKEIERLVVSELDSIKSSHLCYI